MTEQELKDQCANLRGECADKQRSIVNRTAHIHRLEKELDEAQSELGTLRPRHADAIDYEAERQKMRDDFATRKEKNRESLIEMFEKYAAHAKGCVLGSVKIGTLLGCTCGLMQLAKQYGIGESKIENSKANL